MSPSQPAGQPPTVDEPLSSQPPTGTTETPAPVQLGRYRITARLGAGGFGVVYKGYDEELRRDVAIKVPHRERVGSAQDVAAYLAEARTLASLDHPGIVPVYDWGRTPDGLCYLVSKLVEGTDLATHLRRGRPGHAEAADIVARAAEALHHAHRHGLVHRDVKPGNILLDNSGHLYVVDFGLALREEDFGKGPHLAGTPAYMSPEQARREGHRVDPRSDVYSLGVVLYELLTGRRPVRDGSMDEILEQIRTEEPRPPRQLDDTIPKELDRICLKALAKRLGDRYSTARDLADDLRHWLGDRPLATVATVPADPRPSAPTPATATAPAALVTPQPAGDSEKRPIKVVPKGLRSFDASDADFFLELLPGPRDRDGLPEGLRFWKTRLEATDLDLAFSVGLIYGPSGCGKSSLVKAGLLPRLAGHVVTVYVEATPDDTEARLVRGLRRRFPELPAESGLVDLLRDLRRGRELAAGQKVLLVLDQFEQWLHAKRGEQEPELVQGLRQCDGQHVQAVVLVRDDFWMAATRFMRELEIRLVEGQNSAAVDLFDLRHARKVLAAFGRSFGCLPELPAMPAPEQERFLDQAVAGLARDGKVISVRLALFAEMVKGKPWTPAALKQVGGMEGIGAAFLEETFSASTAPPEHRLHQKAARAVLAALLPGQGTDIKGHMRSRTELLETSGYARRPREFEELLHVLDTELRLVTPTDPEAASAEDDAAAPPPSQPEGSPKGEYYQLTHDYLVPALRQWLTTKQRETWRGRAQLRLAERTAAWGVRHEKRHLPAGWEWANIRLFTRRRDWSSEQRALMRAAGRHHLLRAVVVLVLLGVAGWGAYEAYGRLRAGALVRALASAETAEVPRLIDDLTPYRRWAQPMLAEKAAAGDQPDAPSKERLHAALALAAFEDSPVDYLSERLLEATPEQWLVLRDALRPHRDQVVDRLWALLEKEDDAPEAQGVRLRRPHVPDGAAPTTVSPGGRQIRAAATLAALDPDSPRWEKVQQKVAHLLMDNPYSLGKLAEALQPVRQRLIGPMLERYREYRARYNYIDNSTFSLLLDFAGDDAESLAELAKHAQPHEYRQLLPRLQAHRGQAAAALEQELSRTLSTEWKDAPLDPTWAAPAPALVKQIEAAQGLLAERFALCQTLPLDQFPSLAEGLRRSGYRPVRLRPYRAGAAVLAAVVWTRDGADWQAACDLRADEVERRDAALQKQGFVAADVAGYLTPAGAERHAVLWVKAGPDQPAVRVLVGVPADRYQAVWEAAKAEGYVPQTSQVLMGPDAQPRYSMVWWKGNFLPGQWEFNSAYDEAAYETRLAGGNAQPGRQTPIINLQVDVFLYRSSLPSTSQTRYSKQLAEADKTLQAEPDNLTARFQRGEAYYRLYRNAEALADLSALIDKKPDHTNAYFFRSIVHARLGNGTAARQDAETLRKLHAHVLLWLYADAAIALHLDDPAAGLKHLEVMVHDYASDPYALYNAACAYVLAATLAAQRETGAEREAHVKEYRERAIALLRQSVAQGYRDFRHMQTDQALDSLHDHPGFRALLGLAHLDRQYAFIWHRNDAMMSQDSHGLDPGRHLQHCRELIAQGWRPASLAVAGMGEGESLTTASVWHRPGVKEQDREKLAERQAQAAAGLVQLGRTDALWPRLRHNTAGEKPEQVRLRNLLIERLPTLGTDPEELVRRLAEEPDASVRQAILLCLGTSGVGVRGPSAESPLANRQVLVSQLLRSYRDDPDPGVHTAVEWLLRTWKKDEELWKIDAEVARVNRPGEPPRAGPGARRWHVNSQGQTLTVVPGPVEFFMCSPFDQPQRRANEPYHRCRIPRSFAIATKEVTVAEFQRFQQAVLGVDHPDLARYSPEPDCPILLVSWFQAAQYCRWLSEREGVPEAQMCYPPLAQIKPGMRLPANYLSRTGYRLPTEAEWEYACRAGAPTSYSWGDSQDLLRHYALGKQLYLGERTWAVGRFKPNALGLFDMHGSVAEWCHDHYREAGTDVQDDREEAAPVTAGEQRVVRGGSFKRDAPDLRSAFREGQQAGGQLSDVGFRVARTCR